MNWRRTKGEYHSDCGNFTISKKPTHDANGNIIERYPWQLFKGKAIVCCYGLLGEAKDGAEMEVI